MVVSLVRLRNGGEKGGVNAVKVSSEAAGPCDEALVLAAQKLRVRARQHGSGLCEAREVLGRYSLFSSMMARQFFSGLGRLIGFNELAMYAVQKAEDMVELGWSELVHGLTLASSRRRRGERRY